MIRRCGDVKQDIKPQAWERLSIRSRLSHVNRDKPVRHRIERNSKPELLFFRGACISPSENRLYIVILFFQLFGHGIKRKAFCKCKTLSN